MKKFLFVVGVSLLFVKCSQERTRRDFFNEMNVLPDFASSKGRLPLFGFDSLVIDSLSTSIEGQKYWYLNTASNALFNINGYLRYSSKIIYIRPGDKFGEKARNEQVLFDFSGDTTKSWVVQYERYNVQQSIRVAMNKKFYNQLVKDSVFVFKVLHEELNTSFYKELFIQASLRKGLISVLYIDRGKKKLYTIDFLPSARVVYDSLTVPLYPME